VIEMPRDRRSLGRVQYDFSGSVAAVTGGCGGIGAAICRAFADAGAIVAALDVAEPQAGVLPDAATFHRVDVSVDEQCRQSIDAITARHGRLDILVNTAAIQPPASYAPLHELPPELWERMIAINVSGYTNMARHAVRHMLAHQSGVIVNIASAQGHRTAREVPAYGPAKAANLMQTMQWGVEYARQGIRVVSVSPGAINTPLLRASLEAQGGSAALANRHPLGRLGEPEEVASAVLWLASDEAAFITATDLAIDGGLGAFAAFADPYEWKDE
jgi:NAD(P)-dependent dehydrogenase (short-subunit alcohol dehydrogenase family)